MFIEVVDKAQASRTGRKSSRLPLFIGLVAVALAIYPGKAHAQVIREIEANIPFQFHVGNTKLPAGKYYIHQLDSTNYPNVMEISNATGSISALFDVDVADGNTSSSKSELTFNKYGNRYFLAGLYDADEPSWSKVPQSTYEKRVGEAAAEAQAHVPVLHRGQRANGT
jgi:hypothetical protein